MFVTEESIQAAFVTDLKAYSPLTTLMTGVSGTEIREAQWQGADFVYPAVRLYVDVFPSINGCGTDRAMVCIEVYSEEKSSKQAKHLSGLLVEKYQKRRFRAGGLDFSMVRVVSTDRANRTVFAWMCKVNLEVLVSSLGAIDARN